MLDHDNDPTPIIVGYIVAGVVMCLALGWGFFLGTIIERFL